MKILERNFYCLKESEMYRVLNNITKEVIYEDSEYDNALSMMRTLNEGRGKVYIGRSWMGSIERELYRAGTDKVYGNYILMV